MYKLPVRLIQR